MITIDRNDLKRLEKYYKYEPNQETVDLIVNELIDILGKSSGHEIDIYQDIDDPLYYRLYAGCSAVEVYVENNNIQIDFDIGWQLSSSMNTYYSELLKC